MFAYFKSPEPLQTLLVPIFLQRIRYGLLKSEVVPVLRLLVGRFRLSLRPVLIAARSEGFASEEGHRRACKLPLPLCSF